MGCVGQGWGDGSPWFARVGPGVSVAAPFSLSAQPSLNHKLRSHACHSWAARNHWEALGRLCREEGHIDEATNRFLSDCVTLLLNAKGQSLLDPPPSGLQHVTSLLLTCCGVGSLCWTCGLLRMASGKVHGEKVRATHGSSHICLHLDLGWCSASAPCDVCTRH